MQRHGNKVPQKVPLGQSIKQTNYIFVTGGVLSGLGKGLTAACLSAVLQARGFSVKNMKFDPYLNVDPGTMSPFEHGEVFVTDDGAETDLDLGHYERFTSVNADKTSNYTMGRIYSDVIAAERRGDYLGATVQLVPHVTDYIKAQIAQHDGSADFVMVEIGGTVGDIESPAFFEAIRQYAYDVGRERCLFMHLTLVPWIAVSGELKTKPTQHSVKMMQALGLQPDVIVCRADRAIPENELRKIAMFCNVPQNHVISCPDADTIYRVPENLYKEGLDKAVLNYFSLGSPEPDLSAWNNIAHVHKNPNKQVTIGVVGKYTSFGDAYKSLNEALVHGGMAHDAKVKIQFVAGEALENKTQEEVAETLKGVDAVLVPGGFGVRGTEGKINAIQYARESKVPYLGICLGMQMAVVEFARNVAGLKGAHSTEFKAELGEPEHPIIAMLTEWKKGEELLQRDANGDLGGTMRLGSYPTELTKNSLAYKLYGTTSIDERHRHRYEFNNTYWDQLEQAGMVFSGRAPERKLCEIIELPQEMHPYFIAGQFHPEFKSRPLNAHPLFAGLVEAALNYQAAKSAEPAKVAA